LPFVFTDDSTSSATGGSAIFDELGGTISMNVSSDQTDPTDPLRRDLQRVAAGPAEINIGTSTDDLDPGHEVLDVRPMRRNLKNR